MVRYRIRGTRWTYPLTDPPADGRSRADLCQHRVRDRHLNTRGRRRPPMLSPKLRCTHPQPTVEAEFGVFDAVTDQAIAGPACAGAISVAGRHDRMWHAGDAHHYPRIA